MIKRSIDLVGAGIGLTLLSPVLILIAATIRFTMGAPVFFPQQRPGKHGKLFWMYKFRTMSNLRGADGNLLPDDQRLTRLGRWLRKTSLDELPELINVLRGQMSLVGPRPLLVEYEPYYTRYEARRHDVRPGVTGWAQVNGRNALSWKEKLALDVWYVDNRSLGLDLRILMRTLWQVVRRDGISAAHHATMPRLDEVRTLPSAAPKCHSPVKRDQAAV